MYTYRYRTGVALPAVRPVFQWPCLRLALELQVQPSAVSGSVKSPGFKACGQASCLTTFAKQWKGRRLGSKRHHLNSVKAAARPLKLLQVAPEFTDILGAAASCFTARARGCRGYNP